jgi:hypothetical protein
MAFGMFLFRDWANALGGICVSGEETDDVACTTRATVSVVITDTATLGALDIARIGSYIQYNLDACAKSEAERPHFLLGTYSSTATGHIVAAMDKANCKIPMFTPGAAVDVRNWSGCCGGEGGWSGGGMCGNVGGLTPS